MATLDDPFSLHDHPDDHPDTPAGVVFAPVPPSRRHESLSLLLTGNARSSRPAVDQFLGSAASQSLDLQQLWGAFENNVDGEALASLLLIPSPGRTAIVFVSPINDADVQPITSALIRAAVDAQDGTQLHLAQALLDPSQSKEANALVDAGFMRLAHLVYMQRPAERFDVKLAHEPGIEVHHWTGNNRALFADAILASYEQTFDCPGLIGMRDINDIIEGHQATGEFEPDLWTVITRNGISAGVLLLNRVMNRQGFEIVYLGLANAARGQGFGKRLVQHAVGAAHAQGLKYVVLAVDELNKPAMTLYRKMDFTPTTRKLAMIRSLR